ncbi:MerR family transcriptional regulator [Streptomyces sp. NBC_00237]|uniref:MerR family transcriptional regulator n=1 Tax=Streptomyces sp. NBC_00237 TaxID=2975687 RepID=UPI00224FD50C|nr:MerR family transcriptional regulator [Streptomyces sp. NBC_00237]MCX5201565.1 MerR family transcriptional regulator [Streptomyces sp. NBC_00237]
MRIGEIAALVGVTPRAVRHYHHVGLLPEPVRRANGYREYGMRDAVVLARIRRLTELGLGLDEVRDVVRDDAGRELVEVLGELDEDLARQEEQLRRRRERIGVLLAQAEAGELTAEGPVSEELAELLRELPEPSGGMAARDREILTLLETTAPEEVRGPLLAAMRDAFVETPGAAERVREVYALLDALVDADAEDPRVGEAAEALAACIPGGLWDPGSAPEPDDPVLRAFFADFAPAQARAVLRAMDIVGEREGS